MGLLGGAWLTCYGDAEDTPLWLTEAMHHLPAGLQRLGYGAEIGEADPSAGPYGRAVIARLSASKGQTLSLDANGNPTWKKVAATGIGASGRRKREEWIYVRVRPDRSVRGLRSHRQLSALAEGVATLFRPAFLAGRGTDSPTEAAVGLAAYDLWADTLRASTAIPAQGHAVFRHQATLWAEAHRTAAAFLYGLAGVQRTAYANRLRRAADLLSRETADHLTPLTALSRKAVLQVAPALIEGAVRLAEHAAYLLAEAVFIALHLPAAAVDGLLQPLDERLSGMAHQEMLYLARAGTPPLRLLAARRLAGSEGPQVVSTLGQLLYDADYRVQQAAVWALEEINPPGLVRILRSALYSEEPATSELAGLHLTALGTADAEQVLEEWRTEQRHKEGLA
jgi:hypothetical protein